MTARKNGIGTPTPTRGLPLHGPHEYPNPHRDLAYTLAWLRIQSLQVALRDMRNLADAIRKATGRG